ncbi:MAG: lysylphosphatidylglycerol synthase transmembrane domain-containing protein [Pseudobdellovibrio sp.]
MPIFKKIWRPLLAILLLIVLVKKGPFDLNQIKFIFSQPQIVLLGLVIFFTQTLLTSIRWKLFVDLVSEIKIFKAFQLNLIGLFFNFFIPGGVGGDIVKALELSKEKSVSRSQALSTVMSDRVFGLFAMIAFSSCFLLFEYTQAPNDYILKLAVTSCVVLAGLIVTLLFFPVIFKKISALLNSRDSHIIKKVDKLILSLNFTFVTFRNAKIQFKSFFISLGCQLLAIYFMYSVVIALGTQPPSFLVFFSLCCFGFVASALPIMPGGIGVGQYAFYILFSHTSEELGKAAIAAITALQIFTLFYSLIGGLIFSLNPNAKEELSAIEAESQRQESL